MSGYRQKFGEWGEDIAAQYLSERGYTVIMRHFRAERGEIDIIAKIENTIVFVEVKTGSTAEYGPPEERITRGKQRQLYKVAAHFIQQNPELQCDFRFDAVIIDGTPSRYSIRHYPNAFYF